MSRITEMLSVVNSKGNRVSGMVPYTRVNEVRGINRLTSILRWLYNQYGHSFEGMSETVALDTAQMMIKSGMVCKDYECFNSDGRLNDGVRVSLSEGLAWVSHYVSTGKKKAIHLAFACQTGTVNADVEVQVHMGKIWNCILQADYPNMTRYSINDGTFTNVDILNRSVDTYEVMLTSTKER